MSVAKLKHNQGNPMYQPEELLRITDVPKVVLRALLHVSGVQRQGKTNETFLNSEMQA